MAMCSEHICPNCGGTVFSTTAHVQELWKVDSVGNFIEPIRCLQVTQTPSDDNVWACVTCGTTAIIKP